MSRPQASVYDLALKRHSKASLEPRSNRFQAFSGRHFDKIGSHPLCPGCSEQPASHCPSIHADRKEDISMTEQTGFTQKLDRWTDEEVIGPIWDNVPDDPEDSGARAEFFRVVDAVKKAIREKVLESYRNGQKAGLPKRPFSTQKQTSK